MNVDPVAPVGDAIYDGLSAEEKTFIDELINSTNQHLDENVSVEEGLNFRFIDFGDTYDVIDRSEELGQDDLDERREYASIFDENFSVFG